MAVKCWNCSHTDTAAGGGVLLNCLHCGQVMNQNGTQPTAGTGDFPVDWTVEAP